MSNQTQSSALVLGLFIFLGLVVLGYLLGNSAIKFRQLERSVTVKGLSEREYPADVVIWPIEFMVADNSLEQLYATIEKNTGLIRGFLVERGVQVDEISFSAPLITDKTAQQWANYPSSANRESYSAVTIMNPAPSIYLPD